MEETTFPKGTRYQDAHVAKLILPAETIAKTIEWLKSPKGFLLFVGNPGVGKTYFCAAVTNYLREKGGKTLYQNEGDFLRTVRHSVATPGEDYSHTVSKMAGYDYIWILDDIGSSQMTDWQKEVLLLFVDELYENRKPAIITSNIWLNEMASVFSPRFRSRLAATENVVIELNEQDKRQLGM